MKKSLTGADLSRLFGAIGEARRMMFFGDWMKLKYTK